MNEYTLSLLRHALTGAGFYFVSKGYFTEAALNELVGAILVIVSTGWSAYRIYNRNNTPKA